MVRSWALHALIIDEARYLSAIVRLAARHNPFVLLECELGCRCHTAGHKFIALLKLGHISVFLVILYVDSMCMFKLDRMVSNADYFRVETSHWLFTGHLYFWRTT